MLKQISGAVRQWLYYEGPRHWCPECETAWWRGSLYARLRWEIIPAFLRSAELLFFTTAGFTAGVVFMGWAVSSILQTR